MQLPTVNPTVPSLHCFPDAAITHGTCPEIIKRRYATQAHFGRSMG
jgi:hypothetical protein